MHKNARPVVWEGWRALSRQLDPINGQIRVRHVHLFCVPVPTDDIAKNETTVGAPLAGALYYDAAAQIRIDA